MDYVLPRFRGCVSHFAFIALAAVVTFTGCDKEVQISQYEIDTRPPAELLNQKRLLGAVIPDGQRTWFVKMMGDVDAVQAVQGDVRKWVSGLTFQDGEPEWNFPPGWRQVPAGSEMRFATIEVPSEPLPLEISVSFLSKSGAWDEWVAMNVNRWRKQVNLPPDEGRYAGGEVIEGLGSEDEPAIWVAVTGEADDGSAMGGGMGMSGGMGPMGMSGGLPADHPPMDGTMAGPAVNAAPPTGPPARDERLAYDVPGGWEELPAGGMRVAAFRVSGEGGEATITVIPAAGDVQSNVDRWLKQVRSEGVDDTAVQEALAKGESLSVDGRESQRFKLVGDGEDPQSIDGTIITLADDFHLFVKATGDASVVEEQAENIGQFLNSLEIKL